MKYLVIENAGEIEPNAFALMGASTKRDSDEKIGMFGTGSKYAIAVLLEQGINPVVMSGINRIRFGLQDAHLQGRVYQQVVMQYGNKKVPLSYTTTMGLHWNVHHALRELVSNAMDEGDFKMYIVEGAPNTWKDGTTRIFLPYEHQSVIDFVKNFGQWFVTVDRKPLHEGTYHGTPNSPKYKIYAPAGDGMRVYRRGVMVYHLPKTEAFFDYDISWITVREDRTADKWVVMAEIARLLDRVPKEFKLRTINHIQKNPTSVEAEASVEYYLSDPSWAEALEDKYVASRALVAAHPRLLENPEIVIVPDKWADALTKNAKCKDIKTLFTAEDELGVEPIDVSQWEPGHHRIFTECVALLHHVGLYNIGNLPEFVMVKGNKLKEGSMLGRYVPKEDKVLMSVECFRLGKRQVFEMLLEELTHRSSGEVDCTRAFQCAIFRGWADTITKLTGEVL